MKPREKTLCRFLAVGVLMGVLFMGTGPYRKSQLATAVHVNESREQAPVISDKDVEDLPKLPRSDRILM